MAGAFGLLFRHKYPYGMLADFTCTLAMDPARRQGLLYAIRRSNARTIANRHTIGYADLEGGMGQWHEYYRHS